MRQIEFIIALLLVVAVLARLSRRLGLPEPILLVLGGLGIAFVPGAPEVALDPDVVFLVFLPPLLYAAAMFSSPQDLRVRARQISSLAIGLVLVTLAAVAVLGHLLIGLSWPVAFVLGAIVAPTDPVAATTVFRRVGAPESVTTILEGESLVNDGTALTAYGIAVAAVVTGTFSALDAGLEFAKVAIGGVAIGLAVGWIAVHLRKRLDDPPVEITLSLFTPFAAYIPADELGLSGVLAAVTVGLFLNWRSGGIFQPGARLQAYAFWDVVSFLLNSLLFVLVGLQLPRIVDAITPADGGRLALYAGALAATVIGVRMAYMLTVPVLRSLLPRQPGAMQTRERVLLGWSGLRGAVSLAAALALPLSTEGDEPFAARNLVIFLTFSLILATLVAQGLSLPLVLRVLGVGDDDDGSEEERRARLHGAQAALSRIEAAGAEGWAPPDAIERARGAYEHRSRLVQGLLDGDADADADGAAAADAYVRLRRSAIDAEREAIGGLRDEGRLGEAGLRRIERDLDLEESRLVG